MNAEKWWNEIGSGMAPQPDDDWETHASRACKAAFLAGQNAAEEEANNREKALIEIELLNFSKWLKNRSKS